MRLFIVSLGATLALMAALATSSIAQTDSNFPEGVVGGSACTVLGANEAALNNPPVMPPTAKNPVNAAGRSGSDNGFFNKFDLFTDACLGG